VKLAALNYHWIFVSIGIKKCGRCKEVEGQGLSNIYSAHDVAGKPQNHAIMNIVERAR